ncbi:SHOCT domain-containing protein [candidate division KSB1 bacterium]|nr:SHOCT domain-containing protein [candidate division KSB1 bacterium]NIR71077.1 SHOCT domain-containing protein [candidate division KSB1 bacterium]NIS27887.1 SHOCT domain-containing protein [candidate division KSB1 bacterium]NIT74770.1 SHOCT domain-containing protein [candidate division KSB1 bacterium]NIU28547.1 SHOCT domain-containing protein [candidate division KSB1 bacterium]
MHWMDWHWGGWLMMILWWGLIIVGIVFLVKWITGQRSDGTKKEDSALDILKRRYASGEISKEEFQEKKKDLQ